MHAEVFNHPNARTYDNERTYDAADPTLSDALARPQTIFFAGRNLEIRPLNFNDLADLEEKFGDLEAIETEKIKDQRFLIWFILSRTDTSLTETEVGAGLTLDKGKDVGAFIRQVFALSGFRPEAQGSEAQGSEAAAEGESPNAPEPAESQPAGSGTGSSTSSPSSPSAAGTRRKSPAK